MASAIYLPIFFEKLNKIPQKDHRKIAEESFQDREILSKIWGRIMYYNTNIEYILKEHLNCENSEEGLGKLIDKFEKDFKHRRIFTKYSELFSKLRQLNKKCRIIWSHGCLVYSFKNKKVIKHLVYAKKWGRRWIKKKVKINNDYFDQIANKLYPEVIDKLIKVVDDRDANGNLILNRKTSFILPMQDNARKLNFIFVK